jgi:hypothetical protein
MLLTIKKLIEKTNIESVAVVPPKRYTRRYGNERQSSPTHHPENLRPA